MITREGPLFQTNKAETRTLASDHVTKNPQFFVDILAESRFQTRSLSQFIIFRQNNFRKKMISKLLSRKIIVTVVTKDYLINWSNIFQIIFQIINKLNSLIYKITNHKNQTIISVILGFCSCRIPDIPLIALIRSCKCDCEAECG